MGMTCVCGISRFITAQRRKYGACLQLNFSYTVLQRREDKQNKMWGGSLERMQGTSLITLHTYLAKARTEDDGLKSMSLLKER